MVGGAILSLWPPVRHAIASAASWVWGGFLSVLSALNASYETPGWLFGALILLSCIPIAQLAIFFSKREKGPEDLYVEDQLFGVVWRWRWMRDEPTGLRFFCPVCDMELVYQENPQGDGIMRRDRPDNTQLICERCDSERARLNGLLTYAIEGVRREIRRKVRSGEWQKSLPKAPGS